MILSLRGVYYWRTLLPGSIKNARVTLKGDQEPLRQQAALLACHDSDADSCANGESQQPVNRGRYGLRSLHIQMDFF